MKVRYVLPGSVLPDKEIGGFKYTYFINQVMHTSDITYKVASSAKQAMRENVRWLRRKHGVEVTK